jgi:putative chitinase
MNLEAIKTKIPANVLEQIPDIEAKFGLNSNIRLAHFLSQCAHESGNFKVFTENLNYSAKGLRSIFGKYFKDDASALAFERKPEKIANKVYSSRMGNGDEASGDGWKFRGRGYIQLTGKDNYTQFDKSVEDDILANPDLVATKYPLMSAAFFFERNNLWKICDGGADKEDVIALTKRINGGTHGLEDRLTKFALFNSLLK